MGLRPAACYRSLKERPYSRVAVTVHKKNYIGAIPGTRIRQFNMGNTTKEFSHIVDAVAVKSVQVRDNAIEASRIAINRFLNRVLGKDAYFMRIRKYPHQILRENKMAQGAGADRVSDGMSHSFGRPIGRAARIHAGQVVMSLLIDEKDLGIAREAMMRANNKMPCGIRLEISTDVASIGTRPKTIKEVAIETEVKADGKEGEEGKEGEKTAEGKEGNKAADGKDTGKKPEGKDAKADKKKK